MREDDYARFEGYIAPAGDRNWNQSYYYNAYDPNRPYSLTAFSGAVLTPTELGRARRFGVLSAATTCLFLGTRWRDRDG